MERLLLSFHIIIADKWYNTICTYKSLNIPLLLNSVSLNLREVIRFKMQFVYPLSVQGFMTKTWSSSNNKLQHSTSSINKALFILITLCKSYLLISLLFWSSALVWYTLSSGLFLPETEALEKKNKWDNSPLWPGIIVTFLLFSLKRKQCLVCSGELFRASSYSQNLFNLSSFKMKLKVLL